MCDFFDKAVKLRAELLISISFGNVQKERGVRCQCAWARDGGAEVKMATMASNHGVRGACLAVLLLVFACGGRAADEDANGEPTCSQVCRHVVDTCTPGADIETCVGQCEKMRADYMGCPALEVFMRCSTTARVVCMNGAVIDDCLEERNMLSRCDSK
jgi:hypothetical protein